MTFPCRVRALKHFSIGSKQFFTMSPQQLATATVAAEPSVYQTDRSIELVCNSYKIVIAETAFNNAIKRGDLEIT